MTPTCKTFAVDLYIILFLLFMNNSGQKYEILQEIIIHLQCKCIEKYQFKLCSKCDREYGFDVTLGQIVLCRKLTWICRKHSNDVARQVETPSKRTIFVERQIYLAARHTFHVASVVTLYHDCKTS